jgi:hypothetical protein
MGTVPDGDSGPPGRRPVTAAYGSWRGPAATMARAVDAAVSAAQAGDATAFAAAGADLSRVDPEQLAVVLGTVTRSLLERSHPDGLDTDDAEHVMRSCLTAAAAWYEELDGSALLVALAGALGIYAEPEPGEPPPPAGAAVVTHGVLLIASQLTVLRQPLPPVLDAALRELQRAQTVELP